MRFSRRMLLSRIGLSALLLLFARPLLAQPAPRQFNLLGFGDWGIESPDRQQVAETMATYSAQSSRPIDCALSLGDNFYVPLKAADDPEFQTLFEKGFDIKRMNFPFYAVLGNHDYDNADGHIKLEWELKYAVNNPTSRWKIPAKWYRLDLPADHPLVTILMLDSNKDNDKAASMSADEWAAQLKWMNTQLAGSRAAWTICCAHHSAYSNGDHGDNGVLIEQWGSLFQKYKVDFYLCGHDHSLQHLEMPGIYTSYVISGGGGAARKALLCDDRGPFSRSITGFADFTFDPDRVTVSLIAGDGNVLHAFDRTKSGAVTITKNTPSDPKTTHPLQLIQGFDVPPNPPATRSN